MTVIYVAGPMSGLPDFNYPAFNAAAEQLRQRGYKVLSPVDAEVENTTGQHQEWGWYMRRALRMVLDADALALLPGWEASRGATLEVHVADALKMPRRTLSEWLEGA
jgi:hypothetical protein